jgi:hypothetical protein
MAGPFTLIGLHGHTPPLLGIWEPAPMSSFSFSSLDSSENKGEDIQEVIWSVTAPENPAQAEKMIQDQSASLKAVSHSISQCRENLQNLPPHWLEPVSFALNPEDEESTIPEAVLQFNLAHIKSNGPAFELSSPQSDTQQTTITRFMNFTKQTFQLLRPTLHVQTHVKDTLAAFTEVQLDGDLSTVWLARYQETHSSVHRQNLSFTLESRLALFQFLTHVTTGAAVLSARFAFPGGALMALPAVWQYISDVIDQSKNVISKMR